MAESTDSTKKSALLLKEIIGESLQAGSKKKEEMTVARGTLLTTLTQSQSSISDGKPAHNYKVHRENTTLYCTAEDIAPLTDYEFQLFIGISALEAQYNVFADKMLDWGSKLKVDDTVYVELPTKEAIANTGVKGVVRWIGTLPGEEGTKFGIEITDDKHRKSGFTNGAFEGRQLFECEEDCGIFVSLEKLGSIPDIKPANPGNSRFNNGDKASFYNSKEVLIHGTVRWTGYAFYENVLRMNAVGVETDVPVHRNDFEVALTGLDSKVNCVDKNHGKIVVPEEMIQTQMETAQQIAKQDNPCLKEEEREMLRDANIESIAINKAEQERLIRECKQEQEKLHEYSKERDKKKMTEKKPHHVPPKEHQFVMGSRVQFDDPPRYGEIRWMGNVPQVDDLIAGVELDKPMDDCTDGTWRGQRYFNCCNGHAFFCPVTTLKQLQPSSNFVGTTTRSKRESYPPNLSKGKSFPPFSQSQESSYPQLSAGSPASFASGFSQSVYRQESGENLIPVASRPLVQGRAVPDITLNTAVQFKDSQKLRYGIVKWIGRLPTLEEPMAGIELEERANKFGDGRSDGVQYFKCESGKACFRPVIDLCADERFAYSESSQSLSSENSFSQVPLEEQSDQPVPIQTGFYIGNKKGIQGNENSSYLDSSFVALFALSDVFDYTFLAVAHSAAIDQNRRTISDTLQKGIVNPLRKNGVVRYESVMRLRTALDELGKMEGITEKEKDPEEVLSILFKHVLHTKPFISIRRPSGVEQEFFVQLFVEPDPNLRLPVSIGDLLCKMFRKERIFFTKIPSKFLLQVPREFKTYKKIIPDLKLNISDITESGKNSPCMLCCMLSTKKCYECTKFFPNDRVSNYVYFCDACSTLIHKKKSRKLHKLQAAENDSNLYNLDLLSVICIETSHYVCFTRDLNSNTWLFFDSMADRVPSRYNIPRVTDCTRELNEWVYQGDRERLFNAQPRELPELVRRFTQDVYMCVYVQPDIAIYDIEEESHSTGAKTVTTMKSFDSGYDQQLIESPTILAQECAMLKVEKQVLESKLAAKERELEVKEKNFAHDLEIKSSATERRFDILEQEARIEKERLSSRILTLENELKGKTNDLESKAEELEDNTKELERTKKELESQTKILQEKLKEIVERKKESETKTKELEDKNRDLEGKKKEIEGKTNELAAHNTEAWRIPSNRVTTLKQIGVGAYGEVMEGTVRVAVKKIHKEIIPNQRNAEKMEREMKLLAEVRHPNLVQFIGAVFDDQNQGNQRTPPRIVTELLDMNLRSAYEENKLLPQNRLSIFKDVARALDYLHQRYEPIIHRDVSAPNILLQEMPNHQWKGKVSDLGSANFLQQAHTAGEGAIVYSPPEVIPQASDPHAPLPKQTVKIDVYSYGILLCEVTTSRFPSAKNYREMIKQIQRNHTGAYELIIHCTRRDPSDRPSMAEVLSELNKITPF